jgi:NADH:ubiquinone reductase (non-electrogenic)
VGTLEYRCIQEPIRSLPNITYIQAKALNANFDQKMLVCQDVYAKERERESGETTFMNISYDKLLISVGSKTNTFNTPGLYERENKEIFFLKHLSVSRCMYVCTYVRTYALVHIYVYT